jgi:hypothetical protein
VLLGEVSLTAGHKVLVDIDDNSWLIVDDPQGISGQQLKPHAIKYQLIKYYYYINLV